jgi:hypothetical protein
MYHKDVLNTCLNTLNERAQSYGNEDDMFETTAQIASLLLGRVFTKYEISVVMESIKLARRRYDPLHEDSYIDQINYAAFSAQFAKSAFEKGHFAYPDTPAQQP